MRPAEVETIEGTTDDDRAPAEIPNALFLMRESDYYVFKPKYRTRKSPLLKKYKVVVTACCAIIFLRARDYDVVMIRDKKYK